MMNGIKACLFDMDGTIVDSMWMWRNIDIEFLGNRKIELPDDLQKEIEGMSFKETAVYFKQRFAFKETIEELMLIWNDMAMDKYKYEVPLKSGVMDFLKQLKENNIKMGIATSNSAELARACLEALSITGYFDAIVTAGEVNAGKPAPDIYLECARQCGVKPEECLVFEDIIAGIQAGHNAGMKVCAVQDEYSMDVDAEKRKMADYYIENFKEYEIK